MKTSKKEITKKLLNNLWGHFLKRVSYAQQYVDLVQSKGGVVVNDHIAFRTFNTHTGEQPGGIGAIKHLLNFFDYKAVENYDFPKRKLKAIHFEHPDEVFPKIYVSQLEVEQLPDWAQQIITNVVADTPYLISDSSLELLAVLQEKGEIPKLAADALVNDLTLYFKRAWGVPKKADLLKLNDISQYAAWVLVHGNSVSHFTGSINHQNIKDWPDLDSTTNALKLAGIPMKDKIEGEKGSVLRESATLAVKEEVDVIGEDGPEKMIWTYTYYGLAERDMIELEGREKLFSGFLGEQTRSLFDMTRTRDN